MAQLSPHLVTFVTTLIMLIWVIHQSKITLLDLEEQRNAETKKGEVKGLLTCYSEHGPDEKKGFRARFSRGPGVSVLGWPSKGGVYVLEQCFAVELDFLQLDRFQDTPPSSLTGFDADIEEEAHCNRMRQLGATWWRSEFHWKMGLITESVYPNLDIAFIKIGWPAGGGVWVLNITDDEAFHRGAGIIYNAYDMEERCRMIKQLGGVFYENPKDWLDLDLP